MRLLYAILLAATVLFSIVTATNPNHDKVAKAATPDSTVALSTDQDKRFLRVENPAKIEEDEERAVSGGALKKFFTKIKYSKPVSQLRHRYWLFRDQNPITVKAKVGLSGLPPVEAEKKVNAFRDYLDFSKLWREKN
ncbi:hypothetical protein PHYBOEH_009188 [Phytophthora boehmeriae]|uniref:RxLR effector protein n=1 Tax=Phytophthora boehmeriae TaxID=109152 RepID=A0A8T1VV14_9STRA|nr:hypothetical protein PHYBOEH_009188 [Phytophthora boehmeriae]